MHAYAWSPTGTTCPGTPCSTVCVPCRTVCVPASITTVAANQRWRRTKHICRLPSHMAGAAGASTHLADEHCHAQVLEAARVAVAALLDPQVAHAQRLPAKALRPEQVAVGGTGSRERREWLVGTERQRETVVNGRHRQQRRQEWPCGCCSWGGGVIGLHPGLYCPLEQHRLDVWDDGWDAQHGIR